MPKKMKGPMTMDMTMKPEEMKRMMAERGMPGAGMHKMPDGSMMKDGQMKKKGGYHAAQSRKK